MKASLTVNILLWQSSLTLIHISSQFRFFGFKYSACVNGLHRLFMRMSASFFFSQEITIKISIFFSASTLQPAHSWRPGAWQQQIINVVKSRYCTGKITTGKVRYQRIVQDNFTSILLLLKPSSPSDYSGKYKPQKTWTTISGEPIFFCCKEKCLTETNLDSVPVVQTPLHN